jgi:hypothetical protein
MTLIKTDPPETVGAIVEMRQYALYRSRRDEIIREGLRVGIQVWRIASEMKVDRKIVANVKRQREMASSED